MSSTKFTPEELGAFREEFCKGASDSQFELFISEATARNLRPGPHLFFQLRNVNEYDPEVGAKVRKSKATWMSTIGAFRLISQRSGKDAGRGKTRWIYLDDSGMPTIESTIPLPHKENPQLPREPFACVVPVYRSDYKEPVEIVCRFEAYAVTFKSDRGTVLTEMWQRRGPEQLEKCAECASRRAAYPEELGSLFISEEFKNEEDEKPHAETVSPAVVVPPPPMVPKVNQVPATPTNTPRPTEGELVTVLPLPSLQVGAAVPDVSLQTPVSTPVEKKEEKTRKPRAKKEPAPPVSGPDAITDEDVAALTNPTPEDLAANEAIRKNARAAIEEATSFTVDEAAAQGLPAPPDPIPSKEEMTVITAHVRELAAAGASNSDLKDYFLKTGDKTDPKFLSKGEWAKAFVELDKAKAEGTLKEFVKQK